MPGARCLGYPDYKFTSHRYGLDVPRQELVPRTRSRWPQGEFLELTHTLVFLSSPVPPGGAAMPFQEIFKLA
jgi:hypothetical protein